MIETLTIERFKSICAADLEFGRVNLFIGSNGAGKSNILEAIGVVSAAVDRGVGDLSLQQKGVRITPPTLMTSSFPVVIDKCTSFVLSARMSGDVDYRVELTSQDEGKRLAIFKEACRYESQTFFSRSNETGHSGDHHLFDLDPEYGLWHPLRSLGLYGFGGKEALDTLAKYAIYAPQVDFLRGQAVGRAPVSSVGLHGEGLSSAVLSLLKHRASIEHDRLERALQRDALHLVFLPGWANFVQAGEIDDNLVSRAVAGKGQDQAMLYFEDKYMDESRKRLSVYDSSEGTLFLLFVAALLVHYDSPKMFALDNVDNGLNPAMTRKMIEKIIDITKRASSEQLECGPRQVFLTSHNPTALDAFDLFDDEQRVFIVRRDDRQGHTIVTQLKPPTGTTREDWVATHHGNSLSKLWIEGAIPSALGPDL